MGLNPHFIIASDLQSHFVNKDSGLPLQAGYVQFFQDSARTNPKNVYILSGLPPYSNASYVNIGNQVTLGPGGNIMYNNNDVILYYFPYDGDVDTTTSTIDLYFVKIFDVNGAPQKSLEAWPNTIAANTGGQQNTLNYVPNGQFLIHNNIPVTTTALAGQITQEVTQIASGGWSFVRTSTSTATDFVAFPIITTDSDDDPSGAPRFWANITTTAVGLNPGNLKDLRLKFRNVNTFSSDEQQYTFSFYGRNNTGGLLPVGVFLNKNYGTGGTPSAPDETPIATINISTTDTWYNTAILFGLNNAKILGTNNDDYIEITLRFPTDTTINFQLTDFIITPNVVTITKFPTMTESTTLSGGVAGWMPVPNPDGSDLYLPLRLTISGMVFDHDEIGDVIAESGVNTYTNSLSTNTNRMFADGARYSYSGYSPIGIPYNRLGNKYYSSTLQVPIYGTGANWCTVALPSAGTELRIVNNNGAASNPAVASEGNSGFTFGGAVSTPSATTYGFKCYVTASAVFNVQNTGIAAITVSSVTGSPGPTVAQIQKSSTILVEITAVTCPAGAGITAGATSNNYISFYNASGIQNYLWYKVNGTGTDPALGGGSVSIGVNVNSTDSANTVAQKTREAVNAWLASTVTPTVASSITAGHYFLFSVTDSIVSNWYVWYTKDGSGTDPIIANRTGIKVEVLATDTAAQVAIKTQAAINKVYYAAPDLRGEFLRGIDNSAGNDPDAATRWSMVPGIIGDMLGTFELSEIASHNHTVNNGLLPNFSGTGSPLTIGALNNFQSIISSNTGSYETRPINAYVNYVIKY